MDGLYEHLMDEVFLAFLRGDGALLAAVEAFEGDLAAGDEGLTFTLPALFAFARRSYATGGAASPEDRAGYLAFRKTLYAHPTNQRLAAFGGAVEIARAAEDHDRRLYRLVRTPATAPS